jgi:hypothetical protein
MAGPMSMLRTPQDHQEGDDPDDHAHGAVEQPFELDATTGNLGRRQVLRSAFGRLAREQAIEGCIHDEPDKAQRDPRRDEMMTIWMSVLIPTPDGGRR